MLAALTAVSNIQVRYNYTLRCMTTTSRILQYFCCGYFKDLSAPITCAKNCGVLAGVVSKIIAIENALQSNNQFLHNAFGKSYLLRHVAVTIALKKLDYQKRIHVFCKFSIFAKKYILQTFIQG